MAIIRGDNKNNLLQPNPSSTDSTFRIFGYGGNDRIAGAYSADNFLFGGAGNDTIDGGNQRNVIAGGAGTDTIMGGNSRDTITGGGGADRLYGKDGGDRFIFEKASDIGKAVGKRDVIEDFKLGTFNGSDKIDLSRIDAKKGTAKNDKFSFNAEEGADFTGRKGELIWESDRVGGGFYAALIKGDLNGDRKADFVLEVTGSMDMFARDFIL